jgi:hypothetical protein
VYLMIEALAGRSTHISAVVSLTSAGIVGAGTGTAVVVGGVSKFRSQRKELIRLRKRVSDLEARLKRKGRSSL